MSIPFQRKQINTQINQYCEYGESRKRNLGEKINFSNYDYDEWLRSGLLVAKSYHPFSNTGVINSQNLKTPAFKPRKLTDRILTTKKVDYKGEVLRIPLSYSSPSLLMHSVESVKEVILPTISDKSKHKDLAFIDYLTFTFKVEQFYAAFPNVDAISESGDDLVLAVSNILTEILGYGVTLSRGFGGLNYEKSWHLGSGYGLFFCGGKSTAGTACVSITGQGCMAANEAFETPLHDFLTRINASITRIDLAHDIFDGFGYSVQQCREQYRQGLFFSCGQRPSAEARGNWDYPDNKGLSYYVGSRSGGKMLRVYEKGLMIGGVVAVLFRNWVRVECEFHKTSSRPNLPLDMLLFPGQYLAGSYKPLAFLSDTQTRIITQRCTVKATVEKIKQYVEVNCSNYVSFVYRALFDSDDSRFMSYLKENVFKSEVDFPKRIYDAMPQLKPNFPAFSITSIIDRFLPQDDDYLLDDSFNPNQYKHQESVDLDDKPYSEYLREWQNLSFS